MHRKHTVNVLRDLPDLIQPNARPSGAMRERTDGEIAAMVPASCSRRLRTS
jgi:hypothetical protein